jgi:hypothetical protein
LLYQYKVQILTQKLCKGIFANAAVPSIAPSIFLWGLDEKRELLSIIVSSKISHSGHRLRHQALRVLEGSALHAFGSSVPGLRPLQDKVEALAPYMFHIVIENGPRECYFTEKLLDAIVLRAVPIYWGCKRIGEVFDTAGILTFEDAGELGVIVDALSPDLYRELKGAVERNYELAVVAYTSMSPMHQLWFSGAQAWVADLPRIVILAPAHNSQLDLRNELLLRFDVKRLCAHRGPSIHFFSLIFFGTPTHHI